MRENKNAWKNINSGSSVGSPKKSDSLEKFNSVKKSDSVKTADPVEKADSLEKTDALEKANSLGKAGPEALKLNKILEGTSVYSMLSDYGRRLYLPNGIVVQTAEAKDKATRYNATAGVAKENGDMMYMPVIRQYFSEELTPVDIFQYAPMGGVAPLRKKWKEEMVRKNPLLKGRLLSEPIVCAGLTNGLSLVFSLFADRGDAVVLPELYWENYDLLIEYQRQAREVHFPFFEKNGTEGGFNVEGFDRAIDSVKADKVIVLLNFPNNPTGYTPVNEESDAIAAVLEKHAKAGKKLVVIADDAYYGLFYEENVCRQSIFAKVCSLHENIMAVKVDGATKEEMTWGFRTAFITYSFKGCTEEQLNALMQKTLGALRGSISSCSMNAQKIILKGLSSPEHDRQKQAGIYTMAERYRVMKKVLEKYADRTELKPLPFNSGYFMSFRTKCSAEQLRILLLDEYGTGTIRISDSILRVAFSSVDAADIPGLVETLYTAASRLC